MLGFRRGHENRVMIKAQPASMEIKCGKCLLHSSFSLLPSSLPPLSPLRVGSTRPSTSFQHLLRTIPSNLFIHFSPPKLLFATKTTGQFSCSRPQASLSPGLTGATGQVPAVWFAPGCRNIDQCQAGGDSAAQRPIF